MTPYYQDDLVTIYHGVVNCHYDQRRENRSLPGSTQGRGCGETQAGTEAGLRSAARACRQADAVGR
jgi:hypothetical protein